MIIESVHIQSFGKLHNLDLDLGEGLFVIEGPNESGKSTLAAFFRFMFYGFSSHGDGAASPRRHRVSWDDGRADGYLIVRSEEGRFRIERTCERVSEDGYQENCAIVNLETGEAVGYRTAAGEWFFSVPEEAFGETAFFGQMQDIAVNGKKMQDAIDNIIFSGAERMNILRAHRRLKEAGNVLLRRDGRDGILVELKAQRAEKEERLEEVIRQKEALLEKEAALKDTRTRKEAAMREEAKFIRLENDYRNTMIIRTYDYLHELEDRLGQVNRDIAAFEAEHSGSGEFPTYEMLTELAVVRRGTKDSRAALQRDTRVLEDLEREEREPPRAEGWIRAVDRAGGEEAVEADFRRLRKAGFGLFAGGVGAGLVSVLLFILGMVELFSAREPLSLLLDFCLSISFALAAYALIMGGVHRLGEARALSTAYDAQTADGLYSSMRRVTDSRRTRALRRERIREAQASRDAAEEKYLADRRRLLQLAERLGVLLSPDATEEEWDGQLDSAVTSASELIRERGRFRAEVLSLEASIRETRRQLGDRNEVAVRGTVAPAAREKLANLNHKDLLSGIERCHKEVKFYEEKQKELERQLVDSRSRIADPAVMAEQCDELSARIAQMEAKFNAYTLARDAIAGAAEGLRNEISPRLVAYANGLLAEMGEEFPRLALGGALSASLVRDGDSHPAEYYSAGTVDVAYLALRMALVDLLYKEAPPVFLDETLNRQDDQRARQVLRLFAKTLGEGKQCFLFTCHGRDVVLAKEAVPAMRHLRMERGEIRETVGI